MGEYYFYSSGKKDNSVIHIEGRLDSVENLVRLIPEMDYIYQVSKREAYDDSDIGNSCVISIDLEKLEFISEECLKMFQKLKSIYNIKFQNYSLFIEMKLSEFELLD